MNIIESYKIIKRLKELMVSAAYSMDGYDYFDAVEKDVELTVWAIERDESLDLDTVDDIIDFCYQSDMLVENGMEYNFAMDLAKKMFVKEEYNMKSCEFCNCNNNGFCSYREEKLTKEQSNSCGGYRSRESVELTTRQYDLVFDSIMKNIIDLEALLSNPAETAHTKTLIKSRIKELNEIASAIGPFTQ